MCNHALCTTLYEPCKWFFTETLPFHRHADSMQKKPWNDNSLYLRTNLISRQYPILWKGGNMKTFNCFKHVIPTGRDWSISKGEERICCLYFLFTLPVEEPSLDMDKGEEPRAHQTDISVGVASMVWGSGTLQCWVQPEAWLERGPEKAPLFYHRPSMSV